MLEKVRKPGRAKNAVAYVIFGAICLVFVFMGLGPQYSGMVSGGAAAVVNDQVISVADFRNRVRAFESRMGALGNLPAKQRRSYTEMLRTQALEDLIQFELLYQQTLKEGVTVGVAEVSEGIINSKVFQEDGRFNRQRYDQLLKANGLTPGKYEKMLKREAAVTKLRSHFFEALKSSDVEDQKAKDLGNTKVDIGFIRFTKDGLQKTVKVSSADVDAFVKDQMSEIENYYTMNKDRFTQQEEVKARHILVKFDNKAKDKEKKALDKINKIAKELEGSEFAALAKKYSDDPGSKAKGGDLGFFGRGRMVKEFEEKAFSLVKGKVSEPVKTSYGYHLIKVEDKKEKTVRTLDEVKAEIAKTLLRNKGVDAAVKSLENDLKSGKSISSFLKANNLKWDATGEFPLSSSFAPKLGDNAEVLSTALGVDKVKETAKKVVRNGSTYYVLRLNSSKKSEPKKDEASQPSSAAGDVLFSWLEGLKKDSRIQRNTSLTSSN